MPEAKRLPTRLRAPSVKHHANTLGSQVRTGDVGRGDARDWRPRRPSANGRFPRGEQIVEYPSDTNHLLLSATYGIVTTNDGGKNWYYICETAFSHYPPPSATDPGYNGDPLVALTTDEAILANVQARITSPPMWPAIGRSPSRSRTSRSKTSRWRRPIATSPSRSCDGGRRRKLIRDDGRVARRGARSECR